VSRVGLSLPGGGASGAGLGPSGLADAARQIEAAGFASAWTFDAIGRGWLLPDPLTALAVAATVTSKIELGTGIFQVPLRHPVELAQRVLTTHLVSGGRLLFGVGSGSTASDFAALGLDFLSRFRRLDQSLKTMRRLWAGESVDGVSLAPVWTAAAGGPRLFVGSWAGSKWIVRAAQEFDGWIGSGARSTWGLLRQGIERFRGLGGKRAIVTNVVVDLEQKTASPDGADNPADLKCPPGVARARVQRLRELGFDDIVLVVRRHDAGYLKELRELTR
jgi:alkanesulfonate monooxygenase SsuD/methylene tetrahydromethanopterin reductase-like flavin-dependent oxidoreductase (luciferase family)